MNNMRQYPTHLVRHVSGEIRFLVGQHPEARVREAPQVLMGTVVFDLVRRQLVVSSTALAACGARAQHVALGRF